MESKYILLQTVDSALIIAAGALIASIVGGLIAGYFSNRSVGKTLEVQEQRDEKHQQGIIQGVLEAIYEELNAIYGVFNLPKRKKVWKEFEDNLNFWNQTKGLKDFPDEDKPFFHYHFPISVDFLIVYRSNANFIGRINNSDLRRKIVQNYMSIQLLLSYYEENNTLCDRYDEAQRGDQERLIDLFRSQLQKLASVLQSNQNSCNKSMDELIKMLEKELPHLSD